MVQDVVAATRDALAADRGGAVVELVPELDAAFADLRARETGLRERARAVRASREADDAAQAAALDLQQRVGEAVAARGRVLTAVDGYLTGEVEPATAADRVGGQLDAFDALDEAAERLDGEVDVDSLPPVLVLSGPRPTAVPKGQTVDQPVRVRNVGGSPLVGVSLSVDAEPDVDLALSRTDVGTVPADGEAAVTLSGRPARDASVSVRATTGERTDAVEVTVNVRDKREIIGEVITDVFELLKRLRAALDAGGSGGGDGGDTGGGRGDGGGNSGGRGASADSFETKLERVTKSVATAFDRIEDGKPAGAVDGKLRAAAGGASAFVAEVEAQAGKRLPERAAAEIAADGRALVETIEEARSAEV